MRRSARVLAKSAMGALALLSLAVLLRAGAQGGEQKHPFNVSGTFVEGCSCEIVCPCNMGHMHHGCQGVGAMAIASGTYKGVDLSGAKMAYGVAPGGWVRIYTEPKNPGQQEALAALSRAVFSPFGKIEEVKNAKIELTGDGGKYTLNVDGGKIMSLVTEPVLGADQKTPITHHNTMLPFSPTILQGKTLKGSYNDGAHSFTLANSNSYFNPKAKGTGEL